MASMIDHLERIEKKLDWIRWRQRWGEVEPYEMLVDDKFGGKRVISTLRAVDHGPEPEWPGV
jgi:hypothetical protein